MGVMVNYGDLCAEVAQTNSCLQSYAETAERCIGALETYCGESGLSGAAYANSKQYFSNTYAPIMKQLILVCQEMSDRNNQILSSFSSNVPTTYGFAADTDVIEAEIARLKNENEYYRRQIDTYSNPVYILLGLSIVSGLITYYYGCIFANNLRISKYQKVVDGLYAFDGSCAGAFDASIELSGKLMGAISLLSGGFSSDTMRFAVPTDFLKIFKSIERAKLVNSDGSLNGDEFLSLLTREGELTEAEIQVLMEEMGLSRGAPFSPISVDELKTKFTHDMESKAYSKVTDIQKDMLVIMYEYDHSEHAESMNAFFKGIPEDTANHKYSEDIRNIKFITYTAEEPYRGFYLSFIGDIKVLDWQYESGSQNYYSANDPAQRGLKLDFTDDDVFDKNGNVVGSTGVGANDAQGPYVAFFHECFHAIDDALTADTVIGGSTSLVWTTGQDNNAFYNIIREDVAKKIDEEIEKAIVTNVVKTNGKFTLTYSKEDILNDILSPSSKGFPANTPEGTIYKDVQDAFHNNLKYPKTTSGTSDVYEGMTNGTIRGTYGHLGNPDNQYYWYDTDGNPTYKQGKELFATYGARCMTGNELAKQTMRDYFPNAVTEMESWITDYGEG